MRAVGPTETIQIPNERMVRLMAQVIPFKKKTPQGRSKFLRNLQRAVDGQVFFAGVILTVVLPTITYCAYGGPVPFKAFAVSGLLGVVLGLAIYYRYPFRIQRCVASESVNRTQPRDDADRKKAA
jgi:hypothetical protein